MYIAIKNNKVNFISSTLPWEEMWDIVFLENITQEELQELQEKMYVYFVDNYTENSILFSSEKIVYEKSVEQQIQEINNDFNIAVAKLNEKYPVEEQKLFAQKLQKAKAVLSGENDVYIESKATFLGITPQEFAQIIVGKENAFEIAYLQLENERDTKIAALLQ